MGTEGDRPLIDVGRTPPGLPDGYATTKGIVVRRVENPWDSLVVHELVHWYATGIWDTLPPAIEQGMACVIGWILTGGFTDEYPAPPNQAFASAVRIERQEYLSSPQEVQDELDAAGVWIVAALGWERLKSFAERAHVQGLERIPPEWLETALPPPRIGVGFDSDWLDNVPELRFSAAPVDADTKIARKDPDGAEVALGVHWKTQGAEPKMAFEMVNESEKPLISHIKFKNRYDNFVLAVWNITIPPGESFCSPVPTGATAYEISCGARVDERYDELVKPVLSITIPPDGSSRGPVPPGTATYEIASESSLDERYTSGHSSEAREDRATYEHFFQGGFLVPDPFGGPSATYALTIYTFSRADAIKAKNAILAFGLNAPLRSIQDVDRVEIHLYAESMMDLVNGKLVLTFADDRSFSFLDLGLNGDPAYATIADGIPVAAANGWDAYRFVLPLADFNYDPTSGARWRNDFEVAFGNAGLPETFVYSGFFEYESD